MTEIASYVLWIGVGLLAAGYVWAFVLASRVSAAWFIGMLFLGWILYPFFAAKNWPMVRGNTMAMVAGLALVAIGATIPALT